MNLEAARIANYRRRADEVRTIADGIKDPKCRDNLLGLADDYDRMAASIEARRQPKLSCSETVH